MMSLRKLLALSSRSPTVYLSKDSFWACKRRSSHSSSSKSSSDNTEMLTSGMFKIHKRTFAVSFILYSSVVFLMPVVHIFDEQKMNKYLDAKSYGAWMKHIWNTPQFLIQSTERQRRMHSKIKGAYA
jgi:hypothetical protein